MLLQEITQRQRDAALIVIAEARDMRIESSGKTTLKAKTLQKFWVGGVDTSVSEAGKLYGQPFYTTSLSDHDYCKAKEGARSPQVVSSMREAFKVVEKLLATSCSPGETAAAVMVLRLYELAHNNELPEATMPTRQHGCGNRTPLELLARSYCPHPVQEHTLDAALMWLMHLGPWAYAKSFLGGSKEVIEEEVEKLRTVAEGDSGEAAVAQKFLMCSQGAKNDDRPQELFCSCLQLMAKTAARRCLHGPIWVQKDQPTILAAPGGGNPPRGRARRC